MASFILDRFAPDGVVQLVGDETVDGHRGKKVYGKARHRDAVRSSHSHTVFRYGHKWVVLAVLVRLPYTNRPMVLPILVALYRSKKINLAEGHRHKTAAELMCGLLALLSFPAFDVRDLMGPTAMSRFFRHRLKQMSSQPTQSIRAAEVQEPTADRSNILKRTFQEMREHLGLETTRGWSKRTVLRMAPCLLVLYSVIVCFYDTMPNSSEHLRERTWQGKNAITFSDMIISVRHHLWCQWVFAQVPGGGAIQKLSRPLRRLLDFGLTQAA